MDLFATIINQIGILAVYVIAGIIGVKTKIFSREALDSMSKYILKLALPVMVFSSMLNGATAGEIIASLPALAVVAVMYAALFLTAGLTGSVLRLKGDKKRLYKAVSIFGNIGFMGIPLITGIFPKKGILYLTIFSIIDQGILWTVGVNLTVPGGKKEKSGNILKIIINPLIIAMALGIAGVFANIRLPGVLSTTLTKIGATTTPLSMMYIGGLICFMDIREYVKKPEYYVIVLVKMLVFPVIVFAMLRFVPINPELRITISLLSGMPTMAAVAMLANASGSDGDYAIGAVFITTVASVMTIPAVSYIISAMK